ncbi:MAG TPA: hypothetical protein PLV68_20195, partial [Ilumatobacteraceae bacterium]|nr:hypothetical protein [Ilumatobacteraceae bacterium]
QLENLFMVGDKTADRVHLMPTLVNGRPNNAAIRLVDQGERAWRGNRGRDKNTTARRKLYTPSRLDVVELLDDEGMLPAIYFV